MNLPARRCAASWVIRIAGRWSRSSEPIHSRHLTVPESASLPPDFQPNQVAIWTGENHLPEQGFIVEWKDIDVGADGTIQITSQQYLGLTPGVGTECGHRIQRIRTHGRAADGIGCFVPRGKQRPANGRVAYIGADELHRKFQSAGERVDGSSGRLDGRRFGGDRLSNHRRGHGSIHDSGSQRKRASHRGDRRAERSAVLRVNPCWRSGQRSPSSPAPAW